MNTTTQTFILITALMSTGCKFLSPSDSALVNGNLAIQATALALGDAHGCAISFGDIFCWGSNADGQLGDPSRDPALSNHYQAAKVFDPEPGDPWVKIAAAVSTSCALKNSGRLFCWGNNLQGQTGISISPSSDDFRSQYPIPTEVFWHDMASSNARAQIKNDFSEIGSGAQLKLELDGTGGCIYLTDDTSYYCWGKVGFNQPSYTAISLPETWFDRCVLYSPTSDKHCSEEVADGGQVIYYSKPLIMRLTYTLHQLQRSDSTICQTFTVDPTQPNPVAAYCAGQMWTDIISLQSATQRLAYLYLKEYRVTAPGDAQPDPRCLDAGLPGWHYCIVHSIIDQSGALKPATYALGYMNGGSGYQLRGVKQTTLSRKFFDAKSYRRWAGAGDGVITCVKLAAKKVSCTSNLNISFSSDPLPINPIDFLDNTFGFVIEKWFVDGAQSNVAATHGITEFESEVKFIAIGQGLMCALLKNGKVQCIGFNNTSQAGDGTGRNNIDRLNDIIVSRGYN